MKTTLILLLLFAGKFASAQADTTVHLTQIDSVLCITRKKLLEYYPVDTIFQLVKKPAVLNFISAIKACGYRYLYDGRFEDKACQLMLPKWFDSYSLSFGDNDFFISFDDHNAESGNSIVLNYDLGNAYQHDFFHQMWVAGRQYDSLISEGKIMYWFRTKGMYVGEIFLDNKMSVAYYTSESGMERQLRTCILSCRLE